EVSIYSLALRALFYIRVKERVSSKSKRSYDKHYRDDKKRFYDTQVANGVPCRRVALSSVRPKVHCQKESRPNRQQIKYPPRNIGPPRRPHEMHNPRQWVAYVDTIEVQGVAEESDPMNESVDDASNS